MKHPRRIAQLLSALRRVVLVLEALGLGVEQKDVAMRPRARRRGGANVVCDEGRVRFEKEAAVGRGLGLQVGLDPMQDGTEDGQRDKGRVDVYGYDEVGAFWEAGDGEGRLGLGVWEGGCLSMYDAFWSDNGMKEVRVNQQL